MACWVYVSVYVLLALILIKIIVKLRIKQNNSTKCLVGRTVIVTGANSGIGYETALDFAMRGARVILACRNEERGEKAVRRIKSETGNENVVLKIVDLASFKSIRGFADEINANEERLDILVNNAGGAGFGNNLTEDGLQISLQINYAGPFLLTHLLLNKLKRSSINRKEPGRIVNVSALAGSFVKIDLETLNEYPEGTWFVSSEVEMYCKSKLGNILFTTELAKKIEDYNVTVNALHPGIINTEFSSRFPSYLKKLSDLTAWFLLTCREGAQTTIYVALSNDILHKTGKIFDNCKEVAIYKSAADPKLARELWEMTEKLTLLKQEEKI